MPIWNSRHKWTLIVGETNSCINFTTNHLKRNYLIKNITCISITLQQKVFGLGLIPSIFYNTTKENIIYLQISRMRLFLKLFHFKDIRVDSYLAAGQLAKPESAPSWQVMKGCVKRLIVIVDNRWLI